MHGRKRGTATNFRFSNPFLNQRFVERKLAGCTLFSRSRTCTTGCHARFRNVQDIFCDFRDGFLGNTIISLSVVPANRRKGGTTATEPCLGLQLARHYYFEEFRRFELRQSQLFMFAEATFREEPPGV